jgi:hypothetical protein
LWWWENRYPRIATQKYNDVVSWSTMILGHVKWDKGSTSWWVLQLAKGNCVHDQINGKRIINWKWPNYVSFKAI